MTTTTTKTIAEYSADPVNPWAAWLQDNLAGDYRAFASYASELQRLVLARRMMTEQFAQRANDFIAEHDLDKTAAFDAWVAYEVFKADLIDYRLAKVPA